MRGKFRACLGSRCAFVASRAQIPGAPATLYYSDVTEAGRVDRRTMPDRCTRKLRVRYNIPRHVAIALVATLGACACVVPHVDADFVLHLYQKRLMPVCA